MKPIAEPTVATYTASKHDLLSYSYYLFDSCFFGVLLALIW